MLVVDEMDKNVDPASTYSIEGIEKTLQANQRPVAVGVPGYILPEDVEGHLFLQYPKAVKSITIEPAGAIAINDIGKTPGGWRDYQLNGKIWGQARVSIAYADGLLQTVSYRVIKSEAEAVADLGRFLASKQWLADLADPFHRGLGIISYDRETNQKMMQDSRVWIAGLSDEAGADSWLATAEVLYNLYAINGNEKYAVLARRFGKKEFFDPLAAREDHLAGLHANTHIPQVIGAVRGYELTADERYHTISDYFWHEVVDQHTYATGGTSDGEGWQAPGKLAKQLGPAAEECCCSYNMMKLSRHVYGWTVDPKVMDYYERLMFNVRLGTQDKKGLLMYYVPLKPGMWKTFGTEFDAFWCCTGTGVEEYAKSNDSIYFHDADSVYVNLFVGSEVNWPQKGVTLVQETSFPQEEGTILTIHAQKPKELSIKIRIPYWATRDVAIKVNGEVQTIIATPSSYAELKRKWKDGDKIEVSLPMDFHVAPMPDDSTQQSVMYGPLVLAAEMGRKGLTEKMIYGDSGPEELHTQTPMPEVTVASIGGPTTWVERVPGETLKFRTVADADSLSLSPLYRIMDERYSVYLKVNTKAG
jgi:uncharacterized protein